MSVRAFSDPQPERCSQDGQCASMDSGAIALPLAQRLKAFKVRLKLALPVIPRHLSFQRLVSTHVFVVSKRDQAFSEADVLYPLHSILPEMRAP